MKLLILLLGLCFASRTTWVASTNKGDFQFQSLANAEVNEEKLFSSQTLNLRTVGDFMVKELRGLNPPAVILDDHIYIIQTVQWQNMKQNLLIHFLS
jgi:hypothetical protein